MKLTKTLKGGLVTGTLMAATATAALAEFPERNIEIIHPWGPGNAMAMSQVVAKAMGEELGTDMPVISLPGAAGTKGQTTAMGKPADGYTIFDGYVAPLVLQPILGNADWNFADFKPLSAAVANALAIAGQVDEERWSSFEEMMAYCQENRGDLRYSSGSRNNLPHMVIAKVLQSYDCVAQNVPYTQDGNVFKDLGSQVLDFAFINVGNYRSNPDRVNILLVLSELESSKKAYDGAPTIGELGVDLGLSNLGPMGWTWWIVHPDTPDDVTDTLRGAMERAMARPEVIKAIEAIGFVPLDWDHTQYEEIVGSVDAQLSSMGNALAWEEEELRKLD
ncbi:Tripartite tricarboxylate transporter family receptor [Marinovum algicola]|uniref:Tripartite-type tricarboxylate transporter, receptor component TctC n=1 Tax=Marinovum algicola TaxID=42444 RepID=A0A975WFF4_9RHOB|nr:tripartite tricarboxylate transporter substrate-binding protein [Marinovum algicola]SEK11102.1 Tripartite-type tricarboxylate transporter, receptor component TctC [Marinovum algicola]SLN71103.1 Tripartite tricarboxylate transporter family receptor [Marinovum algicola]